MCSSDLHLFPSHDRWFMTSVCNRTFDINNKKVDDYKANYTKYLELRKDRKEKLIQAKKNQDTEIKQMEDNINRFRASASKASFAQSLKKFSNQMIDSISK